MVKTIEKKAVDVIIIGAGMAGVAAAITCARNGARAIVVDAAVFPGGAAVAGFHRHLCGWFANTEETPKQPINSGLAEEFVDRITGPSFGAAIKRLGKVHVLTTRPDSLQDLLMQWLAELEEITVCYDTRVLDVMIEGKRVASVDLETGGRAISVHGQIVIDASGDGAIIALIGAADPAPPSHARQFAGFACFVSAINGSPDLLPIQIPHTLAQAVEHNELPDYARFVTFAPLTQRDGTTISGVMKLSLPAEKTDIAYATRYALTIHGFLKRRLDPYAQAQIRRMSPRVLHRDGARLQGAYRLTAADVLAARKFDDGVVRNAWPIEIWDRQRGLQIEYLETGRHYDIPLRCLKSDTCDNVLAAGRCISVSPKALGSTRVTGTCWSLGEQAAVEALRMLSEGGGSDSD